MKFRRSPGIYAIQLTRAFHLEVRPPPSSLPGHHSFLGQEAALDQFLARISFRKPFQYCSEAYCSAIEIVNMKLYLDIELVRAHALAAGTIRFR